jgi:hypothetical protein
MKAHLKTLALIATGAAVVCPCARAQAITSPPVVIKDFEKGNRTGSLGARLGVFLTRNESVASGFELGYASLSGFESELEMGPGHESEFHINRTNRKLWYATFTVRRHWLNLAPNTGLYAGAGTGVYYLRSKSEFWEPTAADPLERMLFRESVNGAAQFGLNVGGGWTLTGRGLPGALDLDARLHVLPFAGGRWVRSLLTFSAGLNLF